MKTRIRQAWKNLRASIGDWWVGSDRDTKIMAGIAVALLVVIFAMLLRS